MLALLLLWGADKRSSSRPPRPRATTPSSGIGLRVETKRTGEEPVQAWLRRRMALLLAALSGLEPPLTGALADRVALAILAQWAHETNRGKAEFNFNLGGWVARQRDDYHEAVDRLSGKHFRWTAYPDLPTAIDDQLRRLILTFPGAWSSLLAAPESSAWIEELGRDGYYTADPRAYARAWAMHLTELRRML